jgi:hypothetical protein
MSPNNNKIVKILLSYVAYSQIWLNPHVDGY